jgi:hypothetical protein
MESRHWLAMEHGKDTPEFFEAVKEQGLPIEDDEKKIQKLAELAAVPPVDGGHQVISRVGPDGKGGGNDDRIRLPEE